MRLREGTRSSGRLVSQSRPGWKPAGRRAFRQGAVSGLLQNDRLGGVIGAPLRGRFKASEMPPAGARLSCPPIEGVRNMRREIEHSALGAPDWRRCDGGTAIAEQP